MKNDNLSVATLSDPAMIAALGASIGQALAQAQGGIHRPNTLGGYHQVPTFKEASLTPTVNTIYGRYSIFDPCSPGDIFGLQVQTVGLPAWLGFRPNNIYQRRIEFLTWFGPAGTAGTGALPATGAGAPCDDPTGWEYGTCGYWLTHKSWYQRVGESFDPHKVGINRCETSPRYRINGQLIQDDLEWQAQGILNVLQMDIRRDLIHGSHDNAYQMEGLESLIKTGYTDDAGVPCPQIDAKVINWNDDLDGGVNSLGNFFNYLDEVVTEIEYQASAMGAISETDMILLTNRFMATALLDSYACYTTCGVTNSNDITDQALRAQQLAYRNSLNGGPLYDGSSAVGYIRLKSGRRLPIMVDDMLDITKGGASTWCTDIYLLTRRVGSIDVLYAEYLDLRVYQAAVAKQNPGTTFRADAGGRYLYTAKQDNFCMNFQMGTSPELWLAAPWAQARFVGVCTTRGRQPISGDPYQPAYLPGGRPLYTAKAYGSQP